MTTKKNNYTAIIILLFNSIIYFNFKFNFSFSSYNIKKLDKILMSSSFFCFTIIILFIEVSLQVSQQLTAEYSFEEF